VELRGRLQQSLADAGERPGWSLFSPPPAPGTEPQVLRPDAPAEQADQHLIKDLLSHRVIGYDP
jgi:hypothetical protein